MKTTKNKIFAFILALSVFTPAFWSCENALEFNGEQMAPLLVMRTWLKLSPALPLEKDDLKGTSGYTST